MVENNRSFVPCATGSGKSTTLYSTLNYLSCTEKNIISVEDPVEYRVKNVNQVQINIKTGLTFARALRAVLRQDPNIIMVGEIRDTETAEIATRAALTGHLVFTTLHTSDAPRAVSRLLDMGVKPYISHWMSIKPGFFYMSSKIRQKYS